MQITLCGSIDISPKIIEVKSELEKRLHTVNIPYFTARFLDGTLSYEEYMKSKEEGNGDLHLREAQQVDLIRRYWNFIRDSDAILVVNEEKKGIKGYIGGSTLMEMGFAYGQNKKIFLYNPVPKRSEKMHYVDEILDMKPIIISQDLDLIQ